MIKITFACGHDAPCTTLREARQLYGRVLRVVNKKGKTVGYQSVEGGFGTVLKASLKWNAKCDAIIGLLLVKQTPERVVRQFENSLPKLFT